MDKEFVRAHSGSCSSNVIFLFWLVDEIVNSCLVKIVKLYLTNSVKLCLTRIVKLCLTNIVKLVKFVKHNFTHRPFGL